MQKNIIAIVGRTNVGKSTLFNKIVGKRVAIVDDAYGVTRDRIYQRASWLSYPFTVIDTGGLEITNLHSFQEKIKLQVDVAIQEASVIIFVIDGRGELTSEDEFVAKRLHRSKKPVLVAVNKLENKQLNPNLYAIGFADLFAISAIHGDGIGDLLDQTVKLLKKQLDQTFLVQTKIPRIAIIGKPNAGKSSLLNSLIKKERAIVSEIPGTTRDSINEILVIDKQNYEIIDTAGIKKKSKLAAAVESYALIRAMNSLAESQLSLVVIDAQEELSHFHARIIGYALELKKPIILVINKWDLVNRDSHTFDQFKAKIRETFPFISWAYIVCISALKNQRLPSLNLAISNVFKNLKLEIKDFELNKALVEWQIMKPPPSYRRNKIKITYIKQLKGKSIPSFLFFVNEPAFLHFSYKRYLENQLRDYFGFKGVLVQFFFKKIKK